MGSRAVRVVGKLAEQGQVAGDPERSAVRGGDQLLLLHGQVGHRGHGHVGLQRRPRRAVVQRNVDAELGSHVQQAAPYQVLADHTGEVVLGDAVRDCCPGRSVVVRLVEQRSVVVELVPRGRQVHGGGIVRGCLDHVYARPLRQAGRRHVFPRRPAVARQVHKAVVRSRPEHALLVRRLGEREDRRVVLDVCRVQRNRAARRSELALVGAGQVRADLLPALTAVGRLEQHVRRDVEHVRVVRRYDYRVGPLEAVAVVLGAEAAALLGPDGDDPRLAQPVVVAHQRVAAAGRAADGAGVDDVRVVRPDGDVAALGEADRVAVLPRDALLVGLAARHADGAVVLLRRVDPIGPLVVRRDVVELGRRLVVDCRPRPAGVEGHAGAAVVALDHPRRVVRVDPQVVLVPVREFDRPEIAAAVGRLPGAQVEHPYRFRVLGIREDMAVVPRTLHQVLVATDPLPRVAAIVGPVQPRVVGLDYGPDAAVLRGRDRHADAPLQAARQALVLRDVGPGVAAVGRAVQSAVRAAAGKRPRLAPDLPHGGEHRAGVVRVDGEIDRAGVLALEQHAVPGLAAVPRPVDSPLVVRPEDVAQCRHVDEVGVVRMHADAADVPRVAEPQVTPGLAAVGRPVDAVAVRQVAPDGGLARTDVQHIRVGVGYREGAHRGGVEEAVGHVLPVRARVVGLPHAADARPEVEDVPFLRVPHHRDRPSATVRSDASPPD